MSDNFPRLPDAVEAYVTSGKSPARLADALGVSEASVSRWRNGGEPEVKRLQQLARELGVTVAYLAGEDEAAQTQEELAHLRKYRKADSTRRAIVDLTLSEVPDDLDSSVPTSG